MRIPQNSLPQRCVGVAEVRPIAAEASARLNDRHDAGRTSILVVEVPKRRDALGRHEQDAEALGTVLGIQAGVTHVNCPDCASCT